MAATKKVIVLGTEGAEDIELVTIIDILRRGGLSVCLTSVDSTPVFKCANGCVLTPDSHELPSTPSAYEAVVLPGGSKAAKTFVSHTQLQGLLRSFKASGKLVAAICASPMALATSGVLSGLRATIYPGMEQHLQDGGASLCKNETVVVDGNVVTSQGPGTAMPFALRLVELLAGKEASDKVRSAVLYHH